MNTTFSIRVDNDLKKSFLSKAKEKGLEGSVLIRYFMERVAANPNVVQFDIDEQVFDDICSNPK